MLKEILNPKSLMLISIKKKKEGDGKKNKSIKEEDTEDTENTEETMDKIDKLKEQVKKIISELSS